MRTIIARQDAYTRGLKRFYTGTPCKYGHDSERFVVNGGCIQCQNWTSPKRSVRGPKGRNVGWPSQGLIFNVPDLMPEEVEAAFRYMEANGWHDAAVLAIRKDPTLLERHTIPLSIAEQAQLHTKLERDRRIRDAMAAEIEKM